MGKCKRTIVLVLLIIVGLGCVEKDVFYLHNCAISSTSANCNSGADNHNGIHHHSHVSDCDALNGSHKDFFVPKEINQNYSPSLSFNLPKAPIADTWQPPKAGKSCRIKT